MVFFFFRVVVCIIVWSICSFTPVVVLTYESVAGCSHLPKWLWVCVSVSSTGWVAVSCMYLSTALFSVTLADIVWSTQTKHGTPTTITITTYLTYLDPDTQYLHLTCPHPDTQYLPSIHWNNWFTFIHLKLELLTQFPASNDWKSQI